MAVRTPIIAIVGRPNVGKSTLFNRIVGARKAVVEDTPGVTRDRNYALVDRFDVPFCIVDTGGFEAAPEDRLTQLAVDQTLLAAEEADIIYAVFDGEVGLQPGDSEVVEVLRRFKKDVYFIVNKCDGMEHADRTADFYALGVDELRDLSALRGRGVGELIEQTLEALPNYQALYDSRIAKEKLEEERLAQASAELDRVKKEKIVEEDVEELPVAEDVSFQGAEPDFAPVFLPDEEESPDEYLRSYGVRPLGGSSSVGAAQSSETTSPKEDAEEEEYLPDLDCIKVAIVGRPNVGKSTLLNTLTGERRAITSDVPGTTRDSLNLEITRDGQRYEIIDTAGLRKKARISNRIERYSSMRALRALSDCDVAVVLIDGTEGPSEQDAKIVGLAHEQGRGLAIVVNKWDLVEKDHRTVKEYERNVKEVFKFAPYAPILFVSALSGRRCPRILETALSIAQNRERWISTGKLNRVLKRAMTKNVPPFYRGRPLKLFYASQVGTAPPRVVLFFNQPRGLHFSYVRYLKNTLRDTFKYEGTDLKLVFRKK